MGSYDANALNDRLLLGLKGTISEAELHLLKFRLDEGRRAKAQRGEFAFQLPRGYQRRADGSVAFDPDEPVQATIRLVFALFERLGLTPPAEVPATALDLGDHDPETAFRREASRRVDELLGGMFDGPAFGADPIQD